MKQRWGECWVIHPYFVFFLYAMLVLNYIGSQKFGDNSRYLSFFGSLFKGSQPQCLREKMPIVLTCTLDARQLPSLLLFTRHIQQLKCAAGGEAVLCLLNLPVEHIKLWAQVLVRTFARSGSIYLCEDVTQGPMPHAVVFFQNRKANAMISHVQFMECPPNRGHVAFGLSMVYVELRFINAKKATEKIVGVLYAPEVICVDKLYFSDDDWIDALGLMSKTVVWHRYASLCSVEGNEIPEADFSVHAVQLLARERLQALLGGNIISADVRNEMAGDLRCPCQF